MPSSNPLPPKENSLFKRILKCYEQKQYKNGLKFAKQILSNPKFAEHGETLAMKGLTLNCLGRKEEAYEYVRRGLRNDLKSHVCWHVYGLLQRSDKKYDEAIKCYRNALKWEKDNIQILRDLSLLQIQMRDLEGYRDTRYQLFMLRPTQRASWIGFAMAYHLLKDYDMALKILDTFRKTLVTTVLDYEHSELLLYQNMVLQESGCLEEALHHLIDCKGQICDKLAIEENLAQLYLKLGRLNEADSQITLLLNRNPENTQYYEMLQQAKGYTTDKEKHLMLQWLIEKFPRALAPKRLLLNHSSGAVFEKEVDAYLKRGLRKGVPPLFVDLRSLYKDQSKASIVQEKIKDFAINLKEFGTFEKGESIQEPPSALLWTYYYLAQHYDYLGDTNKALYYINEAIDHTPTLIELFVTKAKIFKHAGDICESFKWVDEAQALDTADRYVNSKCAKYMLRANLVKKAEDICSKFTREGVSAMENLNEMQCMWFQTECALAYQRLENWGEALKKCYEIDRHFSEIIEDQFDFHTYCMRKMTLRSYVGLLRLEDVLRSHKFYQKAASCAINVYLRLFDKPLKDLKTQEEINIENLAPSELKKLRNKQRKAQRKAEVQQAEAIAAAEKKELHNKSKQSINDVESDTLPQDELIPDKLARVSDPLEQAIKFLIPLQKLCSQSVETHVLAYEIYSRKNKPLLMLQSVKRAYSIAPHNPLVHTMVVRFSQAVPNWELSEPVIKVIMTQMEPILATRTPSEINSQFADRHSDHFPSVFQCARMTYLLDPTKQSTAIKIATDLTTPRKDITIDSCIDVIKAFRNGDFGQVDNAVVEDFISSCRMKFPMARAFRAESEVRQEAQFCPVITADTSEENDQSNDNYTSN